MIDIGQEIEPIDTMDSTAQILTPEITSIFPHPSRRPEGLLGRKEEPLPGALSSYSSYSSWRSWPEGPEGKNIGKKQGNILIFLISNVFVPIKYVFSSFSFDLFSFNMFQSSILIWISLISLSLILNITPLFYSWRFLDSGRSSRNDANSICTCNFQIAPFVTSLPFVYELQMSGPWIFKPAPAVGQWAQSSHYFSQPRLSVPPLCTGRPPGLPAQNSQWFEEKTSTQKLKRLRHAKDRSAYFKTMAGQKAYCDKM